MGRILSVHGYKPFAERLTIIRANFEEMLKNKSLDLNEKVELAWQNLEDLEKSLVPGKLVVRLTRTFYTTGIFHELMVGRATGGLSSVWDSDGFVVNAQRIHSQQQDRYGHWIEPIKFHDKDVDFRVTEAFLTDKKIFGERGPSVCEFFITRREIQEEVRFNNELRMQIIGSRLYYKRILRRSLWW